MSGVQNETDWGRVAADLAPLRVDTKPSRLRRLSQDYYWFSPVLREDLDGVVADLVATPADEVELLHLISYCARARLGLTPRGGGTGNYGQAMPVEGGLVVDLRELSGEVRLENGVVRAAAGMKLKALEEITRRDGWELRFHPSTWAAATLGGFVAGGTGGVGSINYGTLHDPGNVVGLKIATMEEEPRILELRGADIPKAIHAYGTTGLILEAELALAPAREWHDFVVGFPDLRTVLGAARQLSRMVGIEKKQLCVLSTEVAKYLAMLKPAVDPSASLMLTMIAENAIEPFLDLMARLGGTIAFDRRTSDVKVPPIYEYCWNHTTLQAINTDRNLTYLQVGLPADNPEEFVLQFDERFRGEAAPHVEYLLIGGVMRCTMLPIVRYRDRTRLDEIIAVCRAAGCNVRNPHSYTLDRGPDHGPAPHHRAFKALTDPLGLLNPGKMPPEIVEAR